MGGGQGQTSETSAYLNAWDAPWESDGDELVEDGDRSESPVLVELHKGKTSQCESRRTDEDEVQGLASPCLTSAMPNTDKDSAHLELRGRILQNGEAFATREIIRQTRGKLNRYMPGSYIVSTGKKHSDYVIPDTTTLLVVGFKGAGKSSLINNMIRVLSNKPTGFYRAHVSGCGHLIIYESHSLRQALDCELLMPLRLSDDPSEYGTYFMGEHPICGGSGWPRVSLFDTRGLPEDDTSTSMALFEGWMQDGVRHGQMDLRGSDSYSVKEAIEKRGRHGDHQFSRKKNVNFVIFVVDAVTVFKMKESGDVNRRAELVQLYKNPYLTFKDDRPVVVMTHGDKLSPDDRISTHIYVGEILGVHPVEQIFDISGITMSNETGVEGNIGRDVTLLKMLTFALDCADRNLPYRKSSVASLKEVFKSMAVNYAALDYDRKFALCGMIICLYFLLVFFITACVSLSLILKKRKGGSRYGW